MTSLKKLIGALAILPVVAGAQETAKPLISVYGTFNVNFQYSEAAGATSDPAVKGRFGLSTDSSNVGVRGTMDVGHGLGVVYQCESSAAIDGQGISGICGRNSRIGLSSQYGTLFIGNWDTPFKSAWYGTKADDPFGNTDVFDAAGIMGSPGFNSRPSAGRTAGAAAPQLNFAIRAANSVVYHSPKFSGLSFKAQYSANEFSDAAGVSTPELWSAGVNYDMGPLSIVAAYERHHDWLSTNSTDQGFKAGVGYELASPFGTTTLSVNADYLTYEDKRGAFTVGGLAVEEAKRWAGFVGLKHRTGNHEFRARFSMADEVELEVGGSSDDLEDSGAQQYALGYAYHLSKATQVYAFWTQIMNDDAAQYVFGTAGLNGITPTVAAGADPWAAGVGMRVAF